jgi:hypothetical protein
MATAEEAMNPLAFAVSIETWGDGPASIDDGALMELGPMISEFGGRAAAAAAGGLAGGPSATFTVLVDPSHPMVFAEAGAQGVAIFTNACEKLGLELRGIARVDTMEESYADLELAQPTETYLGVTELASEIGVSRQRVSELRTREDFPAPVAELAAGPVWASSSLRRFLATWERKPGRPLKTRTGGARRRAQARQADRIEDLPA